MVSVRGKTAGLEGAAVLNRALSDCLTKRVAFEQRPKGREGVRLEDIWESTVLDRGNKCKSPEVGAWWRLRTSKEAGGSRARGESGRARRETGARSGATLTNTPSEMQWSMVIALTSTLMGSLGLLCGQVRAEAGRWC